MGVDIFYYSKNSVVKVEDMLWTMNDGAIADLEPIFKEFERKTGYKFDEYSDLVLSPGASLNLVNILKTFENKKSNSKAAASILIFRKILEEAIANNKQLKFCGD